MCILFQYISLYQQKVGHLPSRFEKLVRLSGTGLTQLVYAMITYMQVTHVADYPSLTQRSVSHSPCRTIDISLQCGFSVLACRALFARQPVVHLQSIVSHHLSGRSPSTGQTLSLHSHIISLSLRLFQC